MILSRGKSSLKQAFVNPQAISKARLSLRNLGLRVSTLRESSKCVSARQSILSVYNDSTEDGGTDGFVTVDLEFAYKAP